MWSEGHSVQEALVLLICGLFLLVMVKRVCRRGKGRFPPGPFRWPLIGHLHLVANLPQQALADMSKIYGHIVGLRLGQQRAVVVSSPELAKEVLLTHDKVFACRPPYKFASHLFYPNNLVFAPLGPHWRKMKKILAMELFTPTRLQDLEYVRQDEVRLLLRRVYEDACGGTRAVDLEECVGCMSSRLLLRVLQSNPAAEVAGENLHELITAIEQEVLPTLGDLMPWLSCFDFFLLRRMRSLRARIDKVLSAIVAERKQSTAHYDDLLQGLLAKEVAINTPSSRQETLTLDDIKAILMDLLEGGIHTANVSIAWALAELLKNPNCLHKLQSEIDTMVGHKEQLTDADIAKLSYLKCIVKEVFRLHPPVPLLIPRFSMEECSMRGYILPKNTLVLVNVWAIGRDENLWTNANEFMPERFEGKDMDVKGQHFELLPFGSGRRMCQGMPLAMSLLEVTIANLINKYDWELPDGQTHSSINMDVKKGMSLNRASPLLAIPKLRVRPSLGGLVSDGK